MARYIDADKLIKSIRTLANKSQLGEISTKSINQLSAAEICNCILNAPIADVQGVIRCKDCKYFIEYTDEYMCRVEKANGDCYIRLMNSDNEQYCACEYDDFCSRGRRQEDGTVH